MSRRGITTVEVALVVLVIITLVVSGISAAYVIGIPAKVEDLTSTAVELVSVEAELASAVGELARAVGAYGERIAAIEERISAVEEAMVKAPPGIKRIRYFTTETETYTVELLNKMARDFEAENPGVEILIEPVGEEEHYPKMMAAAKAGTLPDIYNTMPPWGMALAREGYIEPLDDLVDAIGKEHFPEASLNLGYMDGHYWFIPMDEDAQLLYIRKDWFAEKGLDIPKTWDDVLEAAAALTEDLDGDGKIDRYGIAMPTGRCEQTQEWLMQIIWNNGGYIFDKNLEIAVDSPEAVEAIKYYKKLLDYAPPESLGAAWGYYEIAAAMATEKTAMCYYYGRMIYRFESLNPPAGEHLYACIPPIGPHGTKPVVMHWPNAMFVTKTSKYPDIAKKFIQYTMTGENYVKYCLTVPVHLVPIFDWTIKDPMYTADPKVKKYRQVLDTEFEGLAKYGRNMAFEHPGIFNPYVGEIYGSYIMVDYNMKYLLGELTAEEAIHGCAEDYKALLAEIKG